MFEDKTSVVPRKKNHLFRAKKIILEFVFIKKASSNAAMQDNGQQLLV